MNGNKPEASRQPTTGNGILCAKCDHLNPGGSNTCGFCGSHLHISCSKCGHRNARVLARCTQCGHRLHRSLWRRWQRKFLKNGQKVKPLYVALLIIAILVTYKVIIKLAEYRPPDPN